MQILIGAVLLLAGLFTGKQIGRHNQNAAPFICLAGSILVLVGTLYVTIAGVILRAPLITWPLMIVPLYAGIVLGNSRTAH